MTHRQALEVLALHRGRHVVITTHGSIDLWVGLSDTALDFAYVPTSMGQAPAVGLGLALARPERGVVVVTGDGTTVMNLGSLVTIAAHAANLFLVIMDNGVYEVTGGQAVVGAGRTDFAGLARAAGIRRVYSYETVAAWGAGAAEVLSGPGPVLIWLKVEPRPGVRAPTMAPPMTEQIARLTQALGVENPMADNQARGQAVRMRTVTVRVDDPGSLDAGKLITQLDEYQTALYPIDSNHLLSVDALRQPNVTFLTARVDGQVAGCGAFVNQGDFAEIKRMFVLPEFRGLRLGRRILEELESLIRASGVTLARLETGVSQAEALRLYEKSGYERRGPWGNYAEDPLSVFMEKKLAEP